MKELLASIDVGAHAARLVIAEISADGAGFEPVEELEIPVPLGSDVFRTGRIGDESMSVMCGILKKFKSKMDEYSIRRYRAIATSAVREASNSDVFLERVEYLTGIRIQIFTGGDEARLTHLAVLSVLPDSFRFREKRVMMADVGTGACQVSAYDRGTMRFTETVRFGTMRGVEAGEAVSPALRKELLHPVIDYSFSEMAYLSNKLDCDCLIVTGGSVRAMLMLRGPGQKKQQVNKLALPEFAAICSAAETMTVDALCEKYDLRPDVAEAVLPCCMIVKSLCRITKAKSIIVPMISTKYALLENFVGEIRNRHDPFENQILGMASLTAMRYGCDREMIAHTCLFAEELFLKLKPLHGMGHRSLILLKVAALLYKTGLFINNAAYHKHSYYIILNTEIPGLSAEERRMVALIARYHRKSLPKPQHPEYAVLPLEERTEVNRLGAILRLACGLALSRSPENAMTVKIAPGLVTIGMKGNSAVQSWSAVDTTLFQYAFATKIVFV